MTTPNWRHRWTLDRAPLVTCQSIGGGLQGAAGKYYFEVKLLTPSAFGTSTIAFGICTRDTTLWRIADLAVNVAQASGADALVWYGDPDGGSNGYGYPSKAGLVGPGDWNVGEYMAVAVDTIAHLAWVRVPSTGNWIGSGFTADPATGSNGVDFSSGGNSPVTGDIYAFVGGTNTDGSTYGKGTINFGASSFNWTVPTGFTAWETSGDYLNPLDNSNMTLSGSNLTAAAATAITGTNAPCNIVRSYGRKLQA